MCMFWFCATSKPFVCFMFPDAQPDPVVSGGNRGPCVACGIVSRVGVTEVGGDLAWERAALSKAE